MSASPQTTEAFTIPKRAVRRAGAFLAGLVALLVIALLAFVLVRALSPSDPLASAINANEYQAVFLTNGQIYFGKLSAPGGDFYYLRHVYQLTSQTSTRSGQAASPTVVKLSSLIHGPEDLMVINRSQILYVENLKPSGAATKTILRLGG
jgi:hypothetical protein